MFAATKIMLNMNSKNLFNALNFSLKEGLTGILSKNYQQANGYCIEIDLRNNFIYYGEKIKVEHESCLIIDDLHKENYVTLECVNRLLEKGYPPENIVLKKTWPSGHGTSGRLDILVIRNDGSAYLMIECKTFGDKFDIELNNIQKEGGQLFTYFQQDTKAELLMLYASDLVDNKIVSEYQIIKIEDKYRQAGSVKVVFTLWNGSFYETDFWNSPPYFSQEEIFTKSKLKELTEDKGKKLFHGFATILRKHSVSDKPNAFNVIFNLFLAKLYDEQKGDNDELEFQWRKDDNPVDFQIRLHNLHKEGLNDFLKKEIEGIYDKDFEDKTAEERDKAKKKLLKLNKLFDIKSVLNDDDFEQNHRVLKEIVQLIEKFQIRYPRKQKYLSEFFELLLTTGLKQEVGQYFTPQPIAKFIVKSLPIPALIKQEVNNPTPRLPAVIDYAAGSGHFITEIMEEYQDIIDNLDTSNFFPNAKTKVKIWSKEGEPYSWASTYIYGIEKDYRLVKVAKVGCYFYGDGQAQIIHGDGLDSLTHPPKSYIGLLEQNTNTEDSTKNKFSVLVANPPYAVDYCKDDLEYINSSKEFSLYPYLTDNSKEIECLFVERAKQLLKDGGVAGIILPKSILSSSGLYAKTRSIILQMFELIAITEMDSNTFMATPTKTAVLFLRRRNNYECINLKKSINKFFDDWQDVTRNGIEKPITKYVNQIWDNINIEDYISLLKKNPNIIVANHEIYNEYKRKIKTKTEKDFWNKLIETEKDKLFYFILTYPQKTVWIKTGEKDAEKRFLGYEFSVRRGYEGIHAIQRDKTIAECTKLFDDDTYDNPQKASTYIYKAFSDDYNFEIHESLKNNIQIYKTSHLFNFKTASFEYIIKEPKKNEVPIIATKWQLKNLFPDTVTIVRGVTYSKNEQVEKSNTIILTADNITLEGKFKISKQVFLYDDFTIDESKKLRKNDIFMCFSSGSKKHLGKVALIEEDTQYFAGGFMAILRTREDIKAKYLYYLLNGLLRQTIIQKGTGSNINNLSSVINDIQIPHPPIDIQKKIVDEIELLEEKAKTIVIHNFDGEIERILHKNLL